MNKYLSRLVLNLILALFVYSYLRSVSVVNVVFLLLNIFETKAALLRELTTTDDDDQVKCKQPQPTKHTRTQLTYS